MEVFTNQDSQEVLQALSDALPYIEQVLKTHILKISRRTLQDYRNDGILPFIQLPGKVLFRESDIKQILEERLRPAYL